MYYISPIKSPNENRTDVFHNESLKIIPTINGNVMSIFFELYLYANISIPANSLILDINTNFGKFENISMNININKSWNFHRYYNGTLTFNINESKELSQVFQQKTKLNFIPSFRVDTEAFNNAQLTANNSNVHWFISRISLLSEKELEQETYYYSNVYSLFDVSNNNYDINEINKPNINVPTFNKNLNYNVWTNFYDFIKFSGVNNQSLNIDWLKLNVEYYLINFNSSKKSFAYDFVKNTNNSEKESDISNNLIPKVNELYTNFDYDKNEIINSDKITGYKGIFIPFESKGEIQLTFKINSITYYQSFNFNLNQNLFGSNAKYKIYLKSYEQN